MRDKYLLLIIIASILSIYIVSSSIGFTMGPDGNEYIACGYQLFQPNIYGKANTYIPPLYPIFLRILFIFNNLFLFKLFHHFLIVFFVPILIYLALKPFDELIAFVIALIIAFDFNSMIYFSLVCAEAPYIFALTILLFSFCRLLRNPASRFNIYFHGISLFSLIMIRTAGMFLFVFLFPFYAFYFKSARLIKHLLVAFLVPVFLYVLIWNNIGLIKFPNGLYLLYFAQYNKLVDYTKGGSFKRLVDLTEEIYFKEKTSETGQRNFIHDMNNYFTDASNILFDIGMAGYPKEFESLVNSSVKEAMRNLPLWKLAKNIFAMAIVFNKFNPLGEVYNFYRPIKYENIEEGINSMVGKYKEKYGSIPKDYYINYRYNKYAKINYSVLFEDTRNKMMLSILHFINRKFIPLFTFFVYILSLFLMILRHKENRELTLISIFSAIVIFYSFIMVLLPVTNERYRAAIDLFYFVPAGWLYANLFLKRSWSKTRKLITLVFLVFCILLNSVPLSSIYVFLRSIRIFLRLT